MPRRYNFSMVDSRKVILNADQLRKWTGNRGQVTGKRNEIYIVLDNVLDTYNIGSIFRLADAVAAKKIYLCGGTETPPNHRIKKASINTTEVVEWEYCESAIDAIRKVKKFSTSVEQKSSSSEAKRSREVQVIAIEQSNKSVPYDKFKYTMPICLVVGNESDGVSKEVLKMADVIVELPMFGINKSLNVMVSLGIVLYKVIDTTANIR